MSKNNKKSRLLVNVIGIPALISCIFLGDNYFPIYSLLIYCIMFLSMVEWNDLSNVQYKSLRTINFLTISVIFLMLHFSWLNWSLLMIIMIHAILICTLFTIKSEQKPLAKVSSSLFGILWIGIFIGSMILIRNFEEGFELTLMMFLSIWVCDTFAFIFGGKYGKKKLSPLSPNKTWLGSICGFFGSLFIPLVFYLYSPISAFIIYDYLICGLIFGIFGQIGDLFESALKREANIKDTSNILHGHGGILDRFDSLSFASPVLFIFLSSVKGFS